MAGYIGTKAAVSTPGAERKFVFDIPTTTTSITGVTYTPNHVHVFHNGVRLVDGTDYTATNGNSITLTNAAESGDQVVVVSYATYQNADSYTKAEADVRYVNVAGDTMTGNLAVPARGLSIGAREQFNLTNLGDEVSIDWNNVTRNSISYALGGAHTNAPLNNVNSLVVDLNTEGMGGTHDSGPDTRGVQLWFTDTPGGQDGGVTGRFAIRMKQGTSQHPWEKVLTTYSFRRNIVRQSGTFLTSSSTFQNIGVSLTVTPLSANSRFLVFTRFAGYWQPSGDARGRVLRNGTQVYINERVAGNMTTQHESCTDIFLDHPNTTGQVTYVMQGAIISGGSMDFGHAGNACQLMVMEFEG